MIKVYIIESELGWGKKIVEEKPFNSEKEAEQFCREYNNKYNPPRPTPPWYMYARMENQKQYSMLR